MPISIDKSKFEALKAAAKEKNKPSTKTKDPRFINMEIGKTYKFRLIYYTNEAEGLNSPFIEAYTHSYNDKEAKTWGKVTCPTTFLQKSGFDLCDVCKNNGVLYKAGTEADMALYKKLKRRFNGYTVVYTVNDPTTPANNGTAKILPYGDTVKKFLNKEIFGIIPTKRKNDKSEEPEVEAPAADDDNDPVGMDAFKLEDGYDLIIEVEAQGEWPSYKCKFARKATTINVDPEKLDAEIKELKFEKIVTKSTDTEIKEFFNKFVLGASPAASEPSTPVNTEEAKVDAKTQQLLSDLNETATPPLAAAPISTAEKAAPKTTTKAASKAKADVDDVNVDKLLADLKLEGLTE
jgi:hypothetical protein